MHLIIHKGGFITESCNDKCKALEFLDKPTQTNQDLSKASRNPKSVRCTKIGGQVLIGKLYSGHSQSFCQAKDKSIVSTNIL